MDVPTQRRDLQAQLASTSSRCANEIAASVAHVQARFKSLNLDRDTRLKCIYDEGVAAMEKQRSEVELARIAESERLFKLKCIKEEENRKIQREISRKAAELAKLEEEEAERKRAFEMEEKQEKDRIEKEAKAAKDKEAKEKEAKEKEAKEKEAKEKEAKEKEAKEKEAKEKEAKAKEKEAKEKEAKAKAELETKEQKGGLFAQLNPLNPKLDVNPASNTASKPTSKPTSTDPHWADIQAEFDANQERIKFIKENVRLALSKQPAEVRNQVMDIKLELRPLFGMLTNSREQLNACRAKVEQLFNRVKGSGNQLMFHWTLNLYAKLLVEQSESEANAKLQNALPLAMLTVLLWSEFHELGDFVIPRIIKRCPHVIGYHCPIDTAQGRKRMGWKRDGDDRYETLEQYMGRVSGICAVWACITQSKLKASEPHPYPISNSWKFVARHLNRPADTVTPDVYAALAAWWDMTATRLRDAFGKQGEKLLDLLWDDFTRDSSEPPAMRLRGLGENWKETGVIEHAWEPLRK
ncbi:nucleoporin [Starmerella bacillaris]|uniref:mRNA export factor GLE1 n=1 Tax=Starmerella bacillaris TaxID=1247836 RepID=A0AAV5RHW8_STABA|nr:nucleoporin [Starmerella bacillaris]